MNRIKTLIEIAIKRSDKTKFRLIKHNCFGKKSTSRTRTKFIGVVKESTETH